MLLFKVSMSKRVKEKNLKSLFQNNNNSSLMIQGLHFKFKKNGKIKKKMQSSPLSGPEPQQPYRLNGGSAISRYFSLLGNQSQQISPLHLVSR